MLPKLQTIICSTRPGRVGPAVARWFHGVAEHHGGFAAALVDLADFALPVYDEPHHPRLRRYERAHTRRWSESVAAADAYVFVAPEYNSTPTPALINALNFLYQEWNYKPCAFVSYGGGAGGARAVQIARLQAGALRMMPIPEGVVIPSVSTLIDPASGSFQPGERNAAAAKTLLDELLRWARALQPMRA